jgi:hypothetical protein
MTRMATQKLNTRLNENTTYLRVSNPGEAPIEGFFLLGASSTRRAGVTGTTGQFGSGVKHFISLCLARGVDLVVYAGLVKIKFGLQPITVDDHLGEETFQRICFRAEGTLPDGRSICRSESTSLTTEYGTQDWVSLDQGLREVVTNAMDRAQREAQAQGKPAGDTSYIDAVTFDAVSGTPRARAGITQVFIEYTEEVEDFHKDLGRWFLHFQDRSLLKQTFLPKKDRNRGDRKTAVIYRDGVLVREVYGDPSLFDYNFSSQKLRIDEARNLDDYAVADAASRALRDAPVEVLTEVLRAVQEQAKVWERTTLGGYGYQLKDSYADTPEVKEARRATWAQAFKAVAGEDGVLCAADLTAEVVVRKGRQALVVSESGFRDALQDRGVTTDVQVLTDGDRRGVEDLPATLTVQRTVDDVWTLLELLDLTRGAEKPPVHCFKKLLESGTARLGHCDLNTGVISVNTDISGGPSDALAQVVFEELGHSITRARGGDLSRDIQDFGSRAFVALAKIYLGRPLGDQPVEEALTEETPVGELLIEKAPTGEQSSIEELSVGE